MDAFQNYELIFYMAGAELLTSGLVLAIGSFCCLRHRKTTKDSRSQEEENTGRDFNDNQNYRKNNMNE